MDEGIGFGGFFLSNIKKWIIKECLESGNPDSFFLNVIDVVGDIEDEMTDNDNFWEEQWSKLD